TNAGATVKVVKYANGVVDLSGFEAATAYANEAITSLDFFIIKVTAEDGTTKLYYKITVRVGFFTFNSTTRTITDYNEAGGPDVIIPSTIDGVPVEHIGDSAFREKALTSVVSMPASVTSIGDLAFGYNQFTSVIIGNGVTIIDEYAFYDSDLTSVIIPASVTSIGASAFQFNLLTSVTIGTSVESIGEHAFGINHLTSVIIPDSVTSISNGAFQDNLLTSVTIGNGVTSISDAAFSSNLLTSVTIGNSVTSIGAYAFSNNLLISVTIGSSVTSIGASAFHDSDLTSVIIPASVTSIGASAFQFNPLTSVTIGAGVDINSNSTTMGTNTGFQAAYTAGGAGTYNYIAGAWVNRALVIGDSYGGGIVAYILQDGDPDYDANVQHGLIAAAADQSTGIFWHATNDGTTGATATALGTGNANTIAIVAFYYTESNAAKLCYDLSLNGYSDWYLPSKDELNFLFINRVAIGGFADDALPDAYWSSSEYNANNAWAQIFGGINGGIQGDDNKIYSEPVRAVRSF
ncbi:MAG: leucine-rich repeat protein, partial [Candidatus Atribacteria bacterium]|nr:leucine-rich repeat protein [Candidatus Atribacteria bacterium]